MFYVLQNESTAALRRVPILLTDAATGTTAQTGVATTTIFPYVNINGNAFIGGTGNVAEAGYGQYYYEFEVNEIATLGLAGIHITAAGCRDYDAIAQVAAFNLYGVGSGATAYAIAQEVWNTDVSVFSVPQAGGALFDTYTPVSNYLDANVGDVPNQVWNFDISTRTDPSAGFNLYQLGIGATGYASTGLTAGDVWDYAGGRTITGGIADTVTLVSSPFEISYASMAGVANTIWSTDVSGYTNPSAGYDLTQAASGGLGLTAGDVWEYDISGISTAGTAGSQLNTAATPSGAGISAYDVWDFATRTITGGIADTVTSVTNDVSITSASMTGIAGTVWSTLTAPYTVHGTYGHQVLRSDNAATIGEVTLHQSGGSKRVDADVHAFVNNTASATAMLNILTGIGSSMTTNITGNLSGSVGSVTADVNVSTGSMTGIAGTVWSTDISGYTSPSAGYDLANASSGAGISAYDVWDFNITGFGGTNSAAVYVTDTNFVAGNIQTYVSTQTPQDVWTYAGIEGRTITGGTADTVTTLTNPANITTSSMTGIAGTVWSVGSRTITGGTATTVTNPVTFESAQYAAIASSVWNAATRTLTSAGAGLTAGDVWDYAGGRTITGGIADTVTTVSGNVVGSVGSVVGNVSGSVNSVVSDVPVNEATISADVWGYVSRTLTSGAGISAGDVWSFPTRTVTGGAIDNANVSSIGLTALAGIAETVWRFSLSGASPVFGGDTAGFMQQYPGTQVWGQQLSNLIQAGDNLVTAASGSGATAGDVWSYATRTITGGIADTVTTLTNRSGFAITGGTITTVSDKTGYSLSGTQAFNLTGNITGNLSGSVGSVSGNVSGSVASVVGNVGGNVTGSVGSVSGNVGGNVVGSVASVTNPVTFVNTQYAAIASSVWNAGTRTLTSGGSGISASDVWNYVLSDSNTAGDDLVTAAGGAGITAGDVWTYGSRTITGGIADTVTTVSNGVIVTTNNDKTGYALSGAGVSAVQSGLSTLTTAQVGQEVDASLLDVGLTSTVTGRIDATVSSRLASASYVVPPTEAAIAGTVWGYNTRTLTSGAGATAGDVWTYSTRSLTSGAGITVNAATNIINGPYFVKSNVDGQDGTLDVIRGMVQDIQLTVTDAFQNPFDVTALGLAVNFYDQAGTLVTSYGTSNLYAPAGLVQFTLDTAVTGTEGRYNLILSAAGSGNTIKFGPLQTLVRPF